MDFRIKSKISVYLSVACIIAVTVSNVKAGDGPSSKHGPPGSISYDSISSMPQKIRQSLEESAVPGDPYAEPLLEQDVRRFTNYRERIRDSSSIEGKLNMKLTSIQGSDLAYYQYLGLIPDGPRRDGPWTSLTRVYLRGDGAPVFLYEWDFVADGGSIVIYREMLNEKIGETPARLVVKRSTGGRAVSELIWSTPVRDMKLSTWGDVLQPPPGSPYDRRWLIGMAEALATDDTASSPSADLSSLPKKTGPPMH